MVQRTCSRVSCGLLKASSECCLTAYGIGMGFSAPLFQWHMANKLKKCLFESRDLAYSLRLGFRVRVHQGLVLGFR